MTIFEPEVEYVAHQKNRVGILRCHVQPSDETLLRATRLLLVAGSKMNVRGEVIHFQVVKVRPRGLNMTLDLALQIAAGEVFAYDLTLTVDKVVGG